MSGGSGASLSAELATARALLAQGRSAEAEQRLRRLLNVPAAAPAALQLLAALLLRRGAPAEVLALVPDPAGLAWPTALVAAEAARAVGRHAAALEYLGVAATALAAAPDAPPVTAARRRAELLQADSLQQLGRVDAAADLLGDWLARTAGDADAMALLGAVELRRGRLDAARAALEAALALAPGHPGLQFNLALVAERQGALVRAQSGFLAAAAAAPGRAAAWARAAGIAARRLDLEGEARAVAALERALLPSGPPQPGGAGGDLVEPLLLEFLPVSAAAREAALRRQRAAVQAQAAALPPARQVPGPAPARIAARRLRVGYLSPDLGAHAVGGLLLPVLDAHDPERVEVRLYATRERDDAVAGRFRALAPYTALWSVDAATAVAALRADALDVLVDLGGFTDGAMPVLAAARVAPVQLGFLGYIGSVGGGIHDAQLLDAVLAPPAQPFGEPVLRLPGSALPMDRPIEPPADAGALRRAFSLPEGLLFACFNTAHKMDRELLQAWREILAALPEAHLLLTIGGEAQAPLREHWRAIGGRPAQLLFGERLAPERHLARAACCDLFLDCFRYGAGATGVSALRAGLPLLCRDGERPLARLGASLVTALGLQEALRVGDTRAYIERAIALGRDASARAALRTRLLAAMQGEAADPAAFARKLEDAYAAAVAGGTAGVTASTPMR